MRAYLQAEEHRIPKAPPTSIHVISRTLLSLRWVSINILTTFLRQRSRAASSLSCILHFLLKAGIL